VSSRAFFGITLLAGLLSTGCVTSFKRFPIVEVSPGILEGHKPWTQAHFDALRARGVRTILSLDQLPWDIWPERRKARRNGIVYRNVPILASPLQPREKLVREALLILNDPSLRPIFVHCMLGKDRNTFIIGLHRIYFQNWTPQDAWNEMLQSGFHVRWRLRGFTTYFWRHTQKPDWAKDGQNKPP